MLLHSVCFPLCGLLFGSVQCFSAAWRISWHIPWFPSFLRNFPFGSGVRLDDKQSKSEETKASRMEAEHVKAEGRTKKSIERGMERSSGLTGAKVMDIGGEMVAKMVYGATGVIQGWSKGWTKRWGTWVRHVGEARGEAKGEPVENRQKDAKSAMSNTGEKFRIFFCHRNQSFSTHSPHKWWCGCIAWIWSRHGMINGALT